MFTAALFTIKNMESTQEPMVEETEQGVCPQRGAAEPVKRTNPGVCSEEDEPGAQGVTE